MSNLTELDEESALERAVEMTEINQILPDLLPRAIRIYDELKEGSDIKGHVGEFILRARQYLTAPENYMGEYAIHPGWVGENIAPVVLRWEAILEARKHDSATSNYLGTPGQALILEVTVTFTKTFETEYGMRYLTMMNDDAGNIVKYWNNVNILDPVLAQVQEMENNPELPAENRGKRAAVKGDKVKLKASVKEHEIYKGVRGTVIQRARKVELIRSAE